MTSPKGAKHASIAGITAFVTVGPDLGWKTPPATTGYSKHSNTIALKNKQQCTPATVLQRSVGNCLTVKRQEDCEEVHTSSSCKTLIVESQMGLGWKGPQRPSSSNSLPWAGTPSH